MSLEFRKFSVEKAVYGDNKGKLVGEITFVDATKKIEFVLPPEICEKIVEISASTMYEGAVEVAEDLKDQMFEWIAITALPEKRDDGAVV